MGSSVLSLRTGGLCVEVVFIRGSTVYILCTRWLLTCCTATVLVRNNHLKTYMGQHVLCADIEDEMTSIYTVCITQVTILYLKYQLLTCTMSTVTFMELLTLLSYYSC